MRLACLEVKKNYQHNLMLSKILHQEFNIKIYETENENLKSILSLSQNRIVSNFLVLDSKLSNYLNPLTQFLPKGEIVNRKKEIRVSTFSQFRKVLRTLHFIR